MFFSQIIFNQNIKVNNKFIYLIFKYKIMYQNL